MPDTEDKENKRREITLSLGPLKLVLRGYDVLITLVLCLICVSAVYAYSHIEASAAEHKEIVIEQRKQNEQLTEMVFILSLSQDKREKLGLEMPASLRRKLRDRDARERGL